MKKRILMISLSLLVMVLSCVNVPVGASSSKTITSEDAVGKSIKEVFTDEAMAKSVAHSIDMFFSNYDDTSMEEIDEDFILTQDIIENLEELVIMDYSEDVKVKDIQGVGIFKNVICLTIFSEELTVISDDIGNLSKLKCLDIYEAPILTLPSTIGNLTELVRLHLCDCNEFNKLPDSVTQLVELEQLLVHQGKITALPSAIGNLTKLIELEIPDNQLTSLPFSIGKLDSLRKLELTGNLLPSDMEDVLQELLPEDCDFCACEQAKIFLKKNLLANNIGHKNDVDALPLHEMVGIKGPCCISEPSPAHVYMLDEVVDTEGKSVDINSYFNEQGFVNQNATLYASIRATGKELFPNNSENAITKRKIELNLKVTNYVLSFDLNGAEGVVPDSQTLVEGDLATAVIDPTREGFDFLGWNTQSDGKGLVWDFSQTTMPNSNVTLYAQWQEEKTTEIPDENDKDKDKDNEVDKEKDDEEVLGETVDNDEGREKETLANQKKPTQTSDDTNTMIYVGILVGATLGILVTIYFRKKQSK